MSNSNITKKALRESFMELLNERSFNKITVQDITDRCGVNRNTFYYHYQDIYALFEECCETEAAQVIRKYPKLNSIDECVYALTKEFYSKKKAIYHISSSPNKDTYISSIWRICEHLVTTYADTAFADAPVSESDLRLFIRFYKCALFGLSIDWINSGMKEEYAEELKRICMLKKGNVETVIQIKKKTRFDK